MVFQISAKTTCLLKKSDSWVVIKNLLTNQNTKFFKLQYLKNELSYEDEYI